MIRIFNSRTAKFNPGEIDAMFKLRKRVFHDFLKWDVSVRDEWEIDNYDTANPLYVLSYSDDGRLRGSLRLLPTLGPNMLDDTFRSCSMASRKSAVPRSGNRAASASTRKSRRTAPPTR